METMNVLNKFVTIVGRSLFYGFLIGGLIMQIMSWLTVIESSSKMKITQDLSKTKRVSAILMGIYAIMMLGVMVTEVAVDASAAKKNVQVAVAAGGVSLYIFGITIAGFGYGRRLTHIILVVTNKTSTSKTMATKNENSMINSLQRLHEKIMSLAKLSALFLLAIFLIGGGQAMKNGWVSLSSLVMVFLAQILVSRHTVQSNWTKPKSKQVQPSTAVSSTQSSSASIAASTVASSGTLERASLSGSNETTTASASMSTRSEM